MIKHDDLLKQLQAPFPAKDIEWRVQQSGKSNGRVWALIMPYVTNRAIQQRLDEVFGIFGWENEFRDIKTERGLSFLCGITAQSPEGKHLTKWDGADETDFENFKGGLSNSMKRSAVQWGIGRYLYKLEAQFVDLITEKGEYTCKIKDDNTRYYYNSPPLPTWALPDGEKPATTTAKTVKTDAHQQVVEKELKGRNLTQEASECDTLEKLEEWYKGFPENERKKGSAVVSVTAERKREILALQQSTTPAPVEDVKSKIPEFDELKKLTIAGLYAIALEIDLPDYKKFKKAELVNELLKIKNGK